MVLPVIHVDIAKFIFGAQIVSDMNRRGCEQLTARLSWYVVRIVWVRFIANSKMAATAVGVLRLTLFTFMWFFVKSSDVSPGTIVLAQVVRIILVILFALS